MSKPHPTVSVIIPNFNHAKYIGEAIRSVLNQKFLDFEIIVIDDGSTDNSREVVSQFGDRVQYIWQENSGLSAARNTGIRRAQGEFIGVLDADDMYEPDFLSALVPTLQADTEAAAVFCGYRFVDSTNQPLPQIEARSVPPDLLFQALVDGNFLVPESILVRKRCYDEVGLFDTNFRACEDVDMWLRISKKYKVIGVTKALTRHRILPHSMSTDPSRQTENRLAVIQKHFGVRPQSPKDWTDAQRRAYGQAYLASSVEYLQARLFDRAYESFKEMALACPSLLTQLNTFYELGCGEQPKGYRGDFGSLNLVSGFRNLIGMLDRFFMEFKGESAFMQFRRAAYSQAYFAFGLLFYGSRRFAPARTSFLRAAWFDWTLFVSRSFLSLFIKSFVNPTILDWFRERRRQPVGSQPSQPG